MLCGGKRKAVKGQTEGGEQTEAELGVEGPAGVGAGF